MPLITVQMDNTPLAIKKRKHNSKITYLLVLIYNNWWVTTACNREAQRKEKSFFSKRAAPLQRGSWCSQLLQKVTVAGQKRHKMWHVPPIHTAGISDIAMLTAWEGDRSWSSAGNWMQETQEQRTGVHFWKCFHRVSKLISCTARPQPPCHEAFFIKSAYFWTLCC